MSTESKEWVTPIPAFHFSIPFQAIIMPLSVHSFGGGQTKV